MSEPKQKSFPELDGSGIIRVEKRERWLTIENETVRDKRLTFGARGLLSYLLSYPNKWELKVPHLIKQSPAGRDAIYSLLRELERFRYLIRKKRRGGRGRISWLSIIYETPQGEPLTDKELQQLHPGRRKKNKGDKPSLPLTGFPYMDRPYTDKPDTVEPDTDRPYTDKPDAYVLLSEESPSNQLPNEVIRPDEATFASSLDELFTPDDEAAVVALYERATNNHFREGDRVVLRELKAAAPVIKAGIALSAIRAREAGTKINSFKYCRGAIEEMSEPNVLPSYLEYILNKFEQLFLSARTEVTDGE